MSSTEWAIYAESLTKSFGRTLALRGVNLAILRGGFVCLFGPNGAGKTTLIKVLSTLSKPTSGQVSLLGWDIRQDPVKVRRCIGVVSHQTFLYDDLTAEENLRFYGKMYDVQGLARRIDEVIHLVGLKHRRSDRVRTLSRGMQQRLSLARAILHRPQVMLLDEPDTGLDEQALQILREILEQMHQEGCTILMTTHDLDLGLSICSRTLILSEGRVVHDERKEALSTDNFRVLYQTYVGTMP